MDSLCLKTGISGIAPSISISGSLDARANPSQVSAVGRNTAEKSARKSVFSRFSFKYPLKSLWPGGSGNNRYNGLALDDAVLVESSEGGKAVQEDGGNLTMDPEGQNGSWVFKILQVKSVWRGEQGKADNSEDSGNEAKVSANDQSNVSNGDDEECVEEVCDACGVEDDDEEEEVQFDRDSFSRMLRRVSLREAKLYAKMSYLGNLAYAIPKIQV